MCIRFSDRVWRDQLRGHPAPRGTQGQEISYKLQHGKKYCHCFSGIDNHPGMTAEAILPHHDPMMLDLVPIIVISTFRKKVDRIKLTTRRSALLEV